MKTRFRIITIFSIIIIASFVPELFPDFFGDWKCQGCVRAKLSSPNYYDGCLYGNIGVHNATNHWGYRHWIWFLMGLVLFIYEISEFITKKNNN
jgi:hypothetical protein